VVATSLCGWDARASWWQRAPSSGFKWRPWLLRVVPVTLGAGTILLFMTADVIYVRMVFPEVDANLYNPAAMIGLGLTMYALPLAQVMFPKVARSVALTGRSRVMPLALGVTAVGVAAGAIACTFCPSLPLRVIYYSKPVYWAAAPLVPWYAWTIVPLALANVLINNLLAHGRFRIVPCVVAVAGFFLGLLFLLRTWLPMQPPLLAFKVLLGIMAGCNVLLLVIGILFTRATYAPRTAAGFGTHA